MGTCRKSRLAVSGEGLWSLQASACIRAHLGSKLRTAAHLSFQQVNQSHAEMSAPMRDAFVWSPD